MPTLSQKARKDGNPPNLWSFGNLSSKKASFRGFFCCIYNVYSIDTYSGFSKVCLRKPIGG
jgi:hypothetical protein